MSIEENPIKRNPHELKGKNTTESYSIEGDFTIVPLGKSPVSGIQYLLGLSALLLIASASFGLGKLSRLEEIKKPVVIRSSEVDQEVRIPPKAESGIPKVSPTKSTPVQAAAVTAGAKPNLQSELVVASKTGKKYHFPWCSGAKRINEANKITFQSTELARKAGYSPAANCKGLK